MMHEDLREQLKEIYEQQAADLALRALRNGFVLSIESRLTPEGEKSRHAVVEVRHARGYYPKEK